ncbi:hypothetical protein ACHAWF_001904 [Thalassiosira exigua]
MLRPFAVTIYFEVVTTFATIMACLPPPSLFTVVFDDFVFLLPLLLSSLLPKNNRSKGCHGIDFDWIVRQVAFFPLAGWIKLGVERDERPQGSNKVSDWTDNWK